MTNEEIRELIKLVVDTGVAELEVQRGEDRVRIRRAIANTQEIAIPAAPSMPQVPMQGGTAAVPPTPSSPSQGAENEVIVKSPIVGTFYEGPKPGDPPFVKVGDFVEPGQVLCIIESMKLMNEIESEVAGTVVAKLMENGRAVEYGEALFAIRPR
ncbi:MAG TPA: acetyl-CoA carboxylase biotin carboxyl carrier protein [Bryobacteraceae bacterium]|nr:acetyl-CoA carboxylase biotin carboxyl carrier protein [Bryobacteraceae bacterium]